MPTQKSSSLLGSYLSVDQSELQELEMAEKKKKRKYYNFQLKRIWDNQFRLQQQIHTKTCPGKQRLFYDKIFLYSFKDFLHFIKTSKLITNNKWLFLSCINVILFFLTTLPPAVYMYIHIFFFKSLHLFWVFYEFLNHFYFFYRLSRQR